jgi:hypothetical protein
VRELLWPRSRRRTGLNVMETAVAFPFSKRVNLAGESICALPVCMVSGDGNG